MNLLPHKLLLTVAAVLYLVAYPYLATKPINLEREMFFNLIGFMATFTFIFIAALEQMVIYLKKDKE